MADNLDAVNIGILLEYLGSIGQDRLPVKFDELFRDAAAHSRTFACGKNDGYVHTVQYSIYQKALQKKHCRR